MSVNLIDLAVNQAIANSGMERSHIAARSTMPLIVKNEQKEKPTKAGSWTPEEDAFVRKNLGWLSEKEMAKKLGRTQIAVRLRWKRDLLLTPPSKNPSTITANQAAKLINVEIHAFCWWCDHGLVPARVLPGERTIRVIDRTAFKLWVIDPMNWIYFDWKRIKDPTLYKLCEYRAKHWGDEWWTSRQVADYHDVDIRNVNMQIKRKTLPAVKTKISRGGRHKNRAWTYWFILKSDAINARFIKGKGFAGWQPTDRAIQWVKKARAMGWGWTAIKRSMKSHLTPTALKYNFSKRFGKDV